MKRWWLPNQKGTELWPRQTVPPPKLIIEGVETGTPLYRAVANRFSGRLQQFHAKAQQAYALSPNEVAHLRWQWGDGRARYINIQGQEILKLEVDHRVFEEILKPEEDRVPDFVVVDFIINGFLAISHFTATMMTPGVTREDYTTTLFGAAGRATEGSIVPINGIELDPYFQSRVADWQDYSFFVERPVIKFAHQFEAVNNFDNVISVGNNTTIRSLLIDFRGQPKDAMVVVDIYAWLQHDTEAVDQEVVIGYEKQLPTLFDPGELYLDASAGVINPLTVIETVPFVKYGTGLLGSVDPLDIWVVGGSELDHDAWLAFRETSNTPSGEFIDLPSGDTFYEFQSVYWWVEEEWTDSGTILPGDDPYKARGYDWKRSGVRYWQHNTVITPKIPVTEVRQVFVPIDVEYPCDIRYAFYEPGTQFVSVQAPEFRAFWGLEVAYPQRTLYNTITIHSGNDGTPSVEDPWGFALLGRLVASRRGRSIGFELG